MVALVSQANAQTALNIAYTPTPGVAGLFIAQDKGIFKKHGLDVTFTVLPVNGTHPAALMSNSVQIAAPTPTTFLLGVEGGIDIVGIANCYITTKDAGSVYLLAGTGTGIATAADLAGKKVAVPSIRSILHVMLQYWIGENGGDYRSVEFVEIPFPSQADALRSKSVDAVITIDPFSGAILGAGTGTMVVDIGKTFPEHKTAVLFASTRQWAEANSETIAAFRAAMEEASQIGNTDVAVSRALIEKYMKLPPKIAATMSIPVMESKLTADDIKWWIDVMREQGLMTSEPDAKTLVVQ